MINKGSLNSRWLCYCTSETDSKKEFHSAIKDRCPNIYPLHIDIDSPERHSFVEE